MGLVLGIDVSKWQGVMDWAKAVRAGAKYANLRCGSITEVTGECYTDFQWARNIMEAPKHLPVELAYFYFRPNHSPIVQADYTSGLIEPFIKSGILRGYAVDDEVKMVLNSNNRRANYIRKFEDTTLPYLKRMEYNLGIKGVIYTNPDTWKNYITGNKSEAANYDLWIANYEVTSPFVPKPWTEYDVWQYEADGNGKGEEFGASASKSMDMNLARAEWLRSGVVVVEPPIPEPFTEKWMQVSIDRYNIRSTPNTTQGDFGDLQRGRKVKVVGQDGDWYKVEGYVYKQGLADA